MEYNFLNFVQPDIHVVCNLNPKNFKISPGGNYSFLVVLEGIVKVNYKNNIHILKEGEMLIAHRKEAYYFESTGKVLRAYFTTRFFREADPNYDLFKPFSNTERLKIYKVNTNTAVKSAVDNIIRALETYKSRAFILTGIMQMLCELNYIYEKEQPFEINETDSNYAKIISYIDNHLFDKISVKKIAENVFLSERCVSYTVKNMVGMTCRDFIAKRRCESAKGLIMHTEFSLKQIAEKCGFDTYSTFHRNFKEVFGATPNEELKKLRKKI